MSKIELDCCRTKEGHVTNCPRAFLEGTSVTIYDDSGGCVLLSVDQVLSIADAVDGAITKQEEDDS